MGLSLFNSSPLYLRNVLKPTTAWKLELDEFLTKIPDDPITIKLSSGLSDPITIKPKDSLIKWIPHLSLLGRRSNKKPND